MSSTTLPAVPTERSLEWVQRLIGIDTTSAVSNRPLIDLIAAELRRHGVEPVLVADDEGTKLNLLATFTPPDGSTAGGVMFSGHTDVVPVDDQDWSSDPFTPDVRDGSLYGRGTCDMKSFIGIVVAAIPDIVARPLAKRFTLHSPTTRKSAASVRPGWSRRLFPGTCALMCASSESRRRCGSFAHTSR